MSNNLVSEPIRSMQMGQLDPPLNRVDSSGRQMEMGLMDSVSSAPMSQNQGASNDHVGSLRAVPGEPRSQGLPLSTVQGGRVKTQASNPGMHQFVLPNKQSVQMGTRPNHNGPQQLPTTPKRKASMELSSGSSRTSSKRVAQVGNRPWLQQASNASNKGSPQMQSQSSESVRAKMRDSLAAALSASTDSVDHAAGEHRKSTASNEDFSENFKDSEASSSVSNNENIPSSMQVLNCDKQDFQTSYTLTTDDVPFSDGFFMKDELLQGNGLSWVLSDMMDIENQRESQTNVDQRSEPEETGGVGRDAVPSPEHLASRIEAELFKLFGGVNKKYKEKGRSLLFNLKDRNNPELRERVMFGEIPPEQLCSMTAEELASKELTQWRQAKARELAQMVFLPDSDVDIRRLVRKTHKGEFQVEVEQEQDNVLAEEVSGGTKSFVRSQTIIKDADATSPSMHDANKGDVSTGGDKSNLRKDNPISITIPSNDGTDPMQGLMTDDALKDPDFLPPIVSLDEFMESLHSEPPFENLPVDGKVTPISNKDDSEVGSKSKSSDSTPREQADVTPDKTEKFQSTGVNSDTEQEKRINAESSAISSDTRSGESQADMKVTDGHAKERSTNDLKPTSSDAELKASQFHADERYGNNNTYLKTAVSTTKCEFLWEGMLQPNISTTHSVISIFKSGEKTSTNDWPRLLDIKGRVRLDAFEKFLQELPMSRSRAIMVLHFVSKGSSPSEQSTLHELAESYILDERVGFAEPVQGVELYFCPPHKKTVEMLSNILPKEQIEAVNSIDNGLIGIIVWRRTNLTSSISPTTSSHHKHGSKRQYFTRRPQDTNVNANSNNNAVPSTGLTGPQCDDDDDVPPGFGPVAARVEDDLPEFNFSESTNTSSRTVQQFHSINQAPSRPTEQMRELVHRYGQNKLSVPSRNWQDKFGGTIQPWNDDDDDIPEWQPQTSQSQFALRQPMPGFHIRPHIMNQPFGSSQNQPMMPRQYLQPPMNVTDGQRNFGPQWVPSTQQSGGQLYGVPLQGTPWSQHVPRSRGF